MYIPISIGTIVVIGFVLYLLGFAAHTRTVPARRD